MGILKKQIYNVIVSFTLFKGDDIRFQRGLVDKPKWGFKNGGDVDVLHFDKGSEYVDYVSEVTGIGDITKKLEEVGFIKRVGIEER